MTYTVYLTAHEYGFVEVEANSKEEAKEKAYEAEMRGDVHWADRDIEISDIMADEIEDEDVCIRYYICGIGYDEHDHVTDCEKSLGDFDTYEEAYEKFVQLQCKDTSWFFEDTPKLYRWLIQLEECEETDEESTCVDVKNEWIIDNPNL